MIFKWKIQRVESEYNTYEEKGEIDFSRAIDEFQNFPWEEQIELMKESKSEFENAPIIIFYNDRNQKIIISISDFEAFNISYESGSKYAYLKIFSDINKNKENICAEDVIAIFFEGKFEEIFECIEVEDTEEPQEPIKKNIVFRFKIKNTYDGIFSLFVSLMIFSVGLMGLWLIYIGDRDNIWMVGLFMASFSFVFSLPGIILFFVYLRLNHDSTFIIDKDSNTFVYRDSKKELKFTKKEIDFCKLRYVENERRPWADYSCIIIKLKNGQKLYLSFFMGETDAILHEMNIRYEKINSFIPI